MSGSWDTKQAIRLAELCQEGVLVPGQGGSKHAGNRPIIRLGPDRGALAEANQEEDLPDCFLGTVARFEIKTGNCWRGKSKQVRN